MNLKIAYILNSFPKTSETFIYNEILHLSNLECTINIFSLSQPKGKMLYNPDVINEFRIIYLNLIGKRIKVLSGLILFFSSPHKFISTLLKLKYRDNSDLWYILSQSIYLSVRLKKLNINHIHSHFASTASEIAMYVSFFTGIPYSFTTHGYDIFFSPPKNYRYRTYYAKFIVAVSKYNKQYLMEKYHVLGNKIKIIYSGINTIQFQRKNKVTRDYILCIARLEPVKGLIYLVEVCNILKKRGLDIECHIIGEGSQRKILTALISKLNLDSCVFLEGTKSQTDIIKYLHKSKVLVLSSISEGMPISALEAFSCEVPVIATNVCGVSELIQNNFNGFLVPPKNPNLLANKIKILLKNEKLIEQFGKRGREIVIKNFNIDNQVKKIYNLISQ